VIGALPVLCAEASLAGNDDFVALHHNEKAHGLPYAYSGSINQRALFNAN
jgi:hypothetical protein